MKQLTWKAILPLTIISFFFVSKWWYVLPIDAPDTMMGGFPLIWVSDAWHTSLAYQIFVLELIANFLLYFLFWFLVFFTINRYYFEIKVPKALTIASLSISGLICILVLLIGTMPNHIYKVKRDFDIEVLTTGYTFFWQRRERPKYEDYKEIDKPK
ncbi:MAG: hypothetical protein ACPGXZ_03775 [Saprospiraceae bacterium]